MHLAITALSPNPALFISELLTIISVCQCNILELRNSILAPKASAAYLLVEGNWHHLAKLQNNLDNLAKRSSIKIFTQQIEVQADSNTNIAYKLETIGINQSNLVQDLVSFLLEHQIVVMEIKVNTYPSAYSQTPLVSTKMHLLIPPDIQLLSFREELFMFCDSLNLDAVFEPLKW